MPTYNFVNYLWDDAKAASLDPVARLIYRSNILGSDRPSRRSEKSEPDANAR